MFSVVEAKNMEPQTRPQTDSLGVGSAVLAATDSVAVELPKVVRWKQGYERYHNDPLSIGGFFAAENVTPQRVSSEVIFGREAERITVESTAHVEEHVPSALLQLSLLGVLVVYMLLVVMCWREVKALIMTPFQRRQNRDYASLLTVGVKGLVGAIGVVLIGLTFARGVNLQIVQVVAHQEMADSIIFLLSMAAVVMVALYQWLFLVICAKITRSEGFVRSILSLKWMCFTQYIALFTPVFVAAFMLPNDWFTACLCFDAVLVVLFYAYFATELLRRFVAEKVSILQWILYLCTVEILPISTFVLILYRVC